MIEPASQALRLWAQLVRPAAATSPVRASILGKAAEAVTLIALVTLVPRTLGPEHYGAFTLALAVVAIGSSTAALGGPALLSRYVPAAHPAERRGLAIALALRLGRVRAVQALAFTLVAVALALLVPDHFPLGSTLLVSLALALDIAATLAFQVALGLGSTHLWSFRFPLQNLVLVVCALVLYKTVGLTGAIGGIAAGSGAVALVGGVAVRRRLHGERRVVEIPPGALRFGVLQAASGFFTQIAHRGAVVAVLVLGGSSSEAGFAGLAGGIGLAATYAVWQVFAVELPRLSAAAASDAEGVELAARRLARAAALVVAPAALAATFALGPLLPHVVGGRYRGAESALAVALAILPFAPLTALVNQVAALRLDAGARAMTSAIGAAAFALTASFAVPIWDAAGASGALLAGVAATVLAALRFLPNVVRPTDFGLAAAASSLVLVAGLLW